jgi:hypothetical protein
VLTFGCCLDFWHFPASDAGPDAPWATESTCVICGAPISRSSETGNAYPRRLQNTWNSRCVEVRGAVLEGVDYVEKDTKRRSEQNIVGLSGVANWDCGLHHT